jgi:alpha-1,3-mannosyltransferase
MRIVHVVRQFYPSVGGIESVVVALAAAQVAAGHSVRVVTLDRLFNAPDRNKLPARDRVGGAEVVRIPFFGSTRYPIAVSVLRHLGEADIVHVHAIDFFFDFLAWTKPLHRKRLVVSTHGGFFHTQYAARLKRFYFATVTRLSLAWYDGVAAVSRTDRALFGRLRRRGIVCIGNGADIVKYADAGSRKPAKTIAWIGRFSANKRLDRLIGLLAALRRRDPAWTLKIAGRPFDLEVADVAALARDAGVGAAVEIVASPSDAQIRQLLGGCSVLASASDYEGFGLVPVEGISAGLFPVLSDIPAFRDLVERIGAGMVLDFSQPDAAAAHLLSRWQGVAEDFPRMRQALIDAAAAFDWGEVSRAYMELYEISRATRRRAILDVPVRSAART